MKSPFPWIVVSFAALSGPIAGTVPGTEPVVVAPGSEVLSDDDVKHNSSIGDSEELAASPSAESLDQLKKFEAVMDRYYRGNPLEKARADLNRSIREYNGWMNATHAQLRATSAVLNQQVDAIRTLDKSIGEMDERLAARPDLSDRLSVDAYNALVSQRNKRVREYNELAGSHKQNKQAYNDFVDKFDRAVETRKSELDAAQTTFEQQMEAHKHWFGSGEDLIWFKDLNRSYARLHHRRRDNATAELDEVIGRVRTIRRELFEDVVRRYEQAECGAVIVEATLCRHEPCYLLVDTGAMSVTIPSSLAEALGLSGQIGKQVQATVAGGGRIQGRELILPQLSVHGVEAANVRAIVLDEFDAGVDGSLGLSFLKRFVVRIDQSHKDKLIIEPNAKQTDKKRTATGS